MQKTSRILDIFYRLMKGERISKKRLAGDYGVSTRSITRDIGEIKCFLNESMEVEGKAEVKYNPKSKSIYMEPGNFLISKELAAVVKILIGCRALNKIELLELVTKLKFFTTSHDKKILENIISNEMYHYNEVRHDCKSVTDNVWQLTNCINANREITITYYKQDRVQVDRRVMPLALTFSEYYFYLIAYRCDVEEKIPLYYRADRITNITEHRTCHTQRNGDRFDEGELRGRIHFMTSGKLRRIKFSYSGPSIQAILDRIPTARVTGIEGKEKIIEAETYGGGINMFLLSQGSMVKVLEPEEFVKEMSEEIGRMQELYQ